MSGRIIVRLFIDFFLIVVPALVLLILVILNPTFERGFYCDDESLHYPYHEDTVSIAVAGVIAGLLPAILIVVVEVLRKRKKMNTIAGRRRFFHNLYAHLGPFIAGLVFQQLTAEIGKHIIGRLRPHFLQLCKPTFLVEGLEAEGMKTCLELDKPWNHYIVVDRDNETAFQCTNPLHLNEDGTWDKTLQDSVKSFPSAHSSISFYGMLFLAGYFQKRANFYKYASVLTIFFQMTFIVVAFSIALSRISDYKHHWSDVLSGAILGLIGAILIHWFAEFCMDPEAAIQKKARDPSPDEEAGFAPKQTTSITE